MAVTGAVSGENSFHSRFYDGNFNKEYAPLESFSVEPKESGGFRTRPFCLAACCRLRFEFESSPNGSLEWRLLSPDGGKAAEGNGNRPAELDCIGLFRLEVRQRNGARLYGFSFAEKINEFVKGG